jgi:hypothetical protein
MWPVSAAYWRLAAGRPESRLFADQASRQFGLLQATCRSISAKQMSMIDSLDRDLHAYNESLFDFRKPLRGM